MTLPFPLRLAALALLTCLALPAAPLFAQSKAGTAAGELVTLNLLPVQDYAVLDLSGPTSSQPVALISLNDNHQVAFVHGNAGEPPQVVKTWRQGVVNLVQTLPSVLTVDLVDHTLHLSELRASGEMLGFEIRNRSLEAPEPTGPDDPQPGQYLGTNAVVVANGQPGGIGVPSPYRNEHLVSGTRNVTTLYCVSATGYAMESIYTHLDRGEGLPPYTPPFALPRDWMTVLVGGPKTVFFDPRVPADVPDTEGHRFVRTAFAPSDLNDVGWAVSDKLWNGQAFVDFNLGTDGFAYGLSNQGRLLTGRWPGVNGTDDHAGAIWQAGTATRFTDLLAGGPWERQIKQVTPLLLSNDHPADGSFLAVTAVLNDGRDDLLLWKSLPLSPPPARRWQPARMRFPPGVNIVWDRLDGITPDGVIAAIGDAGTGADHALLLLPVTYRELQPASGFDGQTRPHWLMVPQFGNNFARAVTSASGTLPLTFFAVSDAPAANYVDPIEVSHSPVTLAVHGESLGDSVKVKVAVDSFIAKGGELNVSIKRFRTRKVVLHEVIQRDGPGPRRRPTDIKPQNIPTAPQLQAYLNMVFGQQANVYFTVTKPEPHFCDYDANRNGILEMNGPGQQSELGIFQTFKSTDGSLDVFFVHDFYNSLPTAQRAAGLSYNQEATAFVRDYQRHKDGSIPLPLKTTAHEIGHLLGLLDHSDQTTNPRINPPNSNPQERLMYSSGVNTEHRLLIKGEWDIINP